MNRLIIESIEGRIMLGITMFVAIMILVGWVAINEPARMAEFVEQHEGRSIERGAELFAANCSTCHGVNGYGIAGRAPALNNPQLFGYSYLADVNGQIASYQRGLLDINGTDNEAGTLSLLEARRTGLETQLAEETDEGTAEDILIQLLNVEATLSEDIEDVAARIEALETIVGDDEDEIDDLALIGDDLVPELSNSELAARLSALQENIPTRLAEADAALNGVDGEPGLLAQRDALLEELSSPILRGYLPELPIKEEEAIAENNPLILTNYIDEDADRLAQIGFGGSLEGYLTTTLIHGRPGSGDVYSEIMSSWSQRGGGPLRDDQIGDVVAYILNWDRGDDWAIEDFNAVTQFAIQHAAFTGEGSGEETVGNNIDEILSNGLPEGDAEQGELLYTAQAAPASGPLLGCSGCHLNGISGPDTIGTWTRIVTQRLTESQFTDYTGEQYLIESILRPNDYVVSGFASGVMPDNYGTQLGAQDLADLVAYLATQDQ